ncbi:MAG: glutamine-synthetase adenylyltransferase [Pelagimonas sp.]|jgi:glutamate-ammonia-ligase adenylyltransferase|nr:glutamine-synthetase adenylyltransferase [Pelagimonas sp.]
MTLIDRITRLPRAFDADKGADTLLAAPWATGPLAELLSGIGGSAPYLKGLIEKESDWLVTACDCPDTALDQLFTDLKQVPFDQIGVALRQGKRRVALLTAVCDVAGVWPLETVTGALSDFADLATSLAMQAAVAHEIKRKKLPGQTEDDIATCAGMVALAMGKGGARELNYSSDIDLICLFDETRYERDDYHEARASLVRATRKMAATLSDLTGEGYVFRTDLRLRPDPSVTPVCMAMEAAERYYESVGRTWERAAYIKARSAAGDIEAGQRFLTTLTPFVWRKHLDFAAIQDAHDMRLRIREHKGLGGQITLPGHNMKLGRGGIREIEFFTQTRQLIAGGRDPDLRERATVPGLRVLAQKGWIPEEAAEKLADHYRAHREVEHRIQMINDAQTHDMPKSLDGMARIACLMGLSVDEMQSQISARLTEVHDITEGFFAPDGASVEEVPSAFEHSDLPSRWPSYACLRSDRAQELFRRIQPEILRKLAKAPRPDDALLAFDSFLAGLPAGVQLFSLFEANPQLVDLLIDIVSTSSDLAKFLGRNAQVLDAVIGGDFFSPWPGKTALRNELADRLAAESDYERRLDLARRWAKEWHFRVGVHLLRGLKDPDEAAGAYADLAEASLAALWPVVADEFARKYGPCPGRGAVVLGMGSLGSARLHSRSDLDVIVIYDADGVEYSEGKKSLASRTYYARLTQAMVTAVTAPMSEGRLYEIDMRLRPSGNQGPVATSWSAFQDYQSNDAWVWEHLALTRARVVAGASELAQDVEAFREDLLARPSDQTRVLRDVAEMRQRIEEAKGGRGPWEPKIGAGRMQDIELIAQSASLIKGRGIRQTPRALRAADWLDAEQKEALIAAYDLCWSLQIGSRLVSEEALQPETLGAGGCAFLERLTGVSGMDALLSELDQRTRRAAEIINQVLPAIEG